MVKMLEEVAKDWMYLTIQHHEETERAKMALNKVHRTYQMQLLHYQGQAQATASLIKKLDEKQATEDKCNMGLNQIHDICREIVRSNHNKQTNAEI